MQLCGGLSILWHCLSLRFERKLTFSSPVATVEVSKFAGILSAALSQHHVPLIHWKYCVNGIVLIHIVFLLVMASGPITSWQIDRETIEMVRDSIWGTPKSLKMVTTAMKLKDTCSLEENYDQPRQHIKKQRRYCANKVHLVQTMAFPIAIYACESWIIKKAEH